MYKLILVNNIPSGYAFDEAGEYTEAQAKDCVMCGKINPTDQEVVLKKQEMDSLYANEQYKRMRSAEYPRFTDYIDGVVKGDQEQIQAYIDACLAVKAKYPKPEGN
jgi:hypothetical protein